MARASEQMEEMDRHFFEAESMKQQRLKQLRLENQGKVTVRDFQGRLKQYWRTTLAGAYPPGACHSAARALGRAAPSAAWRRDGDPLLPSHWEAELQRAAKLGSLHILAFATALCVVTDCWVNKDLPLVDTLLEECFEQLFLGAGSKVAARHALAAFAHRFGISLRAPSVFPKAKGALSGWGKLEPDLTSGPLCWAAACLMAEYLAELKTVLQFDTYPRPGELLGLLVPCCLLPQPSAGSGYNEMGLVVGASAVVMGDNNHSRVTKTGLQDDTVLIDSESRVGVAGAFVAVVRAANKARQGRLMFLHTYASYNRTLKKAAAAVGLLSKVTAHLPRHGGPSEDYLRGARSLADIQARGRWASVRSVQRYQKSRRALASFCRLSTAVKAEAKRAEARELCFLAWASRSAPCGTDTGACFSFSSACQWSDMGFILQLHGLLNSGLARRFD
ncbi:unnamed protein product [Prorocentrum cordatum]|uniref:Uncharacterized protein n=1 Tax=Prorocentrum cordatum TaxID=2364126 RepID=A0ABN9W7N6_9DINO|nr:unnamed protein product [Polarella glacialis]